jgi:hypothetical protein
MSPPASSPASAIPMKIESSEDTELFLIRNNYSLAANGVGSITTSQPPGLYKIRALRAGAEIDHLIEVGTTPVTHRIDVDPPHGSGPSPSLLKDRDAVAFFAYVAGANGPKRERNRESVFVIGSDHSDPNRHPLRGLYVFPWGNPADAQALQPLRRETRNIAGRVWAAARLDLPPGRYVVEARLDDRTVRTALPVLAGRETHVTISRRDWLGGVADSGAATGHYDADGWRTEWIDLGIDYARSLRYAHVIEKTAPDFAALFATRAKALQRRNSLRIALARHRKLVLDKTLIDALLREKFDDPYVGLAAAHLMFDAIEAKAARAAANKPLGTVAKVDFSPGIVRIVLGNLQTLLGGRPSAKKAADPDLAALLLRAGRVKPHAIRIETAPLYWRSWEILLNAALVDPAVWIDPSLWLEAKAAEGWGCSLVWSPNPISLEQYLDMMPRSSRDLPPSSALEGRFPDAADRRAGELRAQALQYRIPLSVIEKG